VCKKKKIQRDKLENRDRRTHRLRLKYTFLHDLLHYKRLVSYNDVCILDLWFFLGCSSQIGINPNYDFRNSFMKLIWTLIIIFSKLV